MATVTKTIGTDSRIYSTITLWSADIDNTTYPSAGTLALGECYNDSDFGEAAILNTSDSNIDDIVLSVASGERHDGTAGSGVRMLHASTPVRIDMTNTGSTVTVEWIEVDRNSVSSLLNLIDMNQTSNTSTLQKCILHNAEANVGGALIGINATVTSGTMICHNNIIYDFLKTSGNAGTIFGFFTTAGGGSIIEFSNNTIHDLFYDLGTYTGTFSGVKGGSTSGHDFFNNVVTDVIQNGSGTALCFDQEASADDDFNASSDDTADDGGGGNTLINIITANQYVSTTGGSEDLHIQDTAADIFEEGTDLGTTPAGVNIDIDDYDRDAGATTWSIGAHDGNNLRGAPTGPPKTIGFGYGQFVA